MQHSQISFAFKSHLGLALKGCCCVFVLPGQSRALFTTPVIVRCNQTVSDSRIFSIPVTPAPFPWLYVHGLRIFLPIKLIFNTVQRSSNRPQTWTRCLPSVFYHTTSSFLAKVSGFLSTFFLEVDQWASLISLLSLCASPLREIYARGPLPRRKCLRAIVHGREDIVPHCLLTSCLQSYNQTRQNRRHFLICKQLNV